MRVSMPGLQHANREYFNQLPQILKNFFEKYKPSTHAEYSTTPTLTTDPKANPFLANKHPITQKYHAPKYSLRRQSVLYKTALQYGIADLLPPINKKFYEEKYESKPYMKGVLRPKGHKRELNKSIRQDEVKQAMEKMEDKVVEVKGSKYKKKLLEKKKVVEKSWY